MKSEHPFDFLFVVCGDTQLERELFDYEVDGSSAATDLSIPDSGSPYSSCPPFAYPPN